MSYAPSKREGGTVERSYTTIDRSGWPRGAWDHEPDKGLAGQLAGGAA